MTNATVRPSGNHEEKSPKIGFWRLRSVRLQIGLLLCLNYFVLAYMRHSLSMGMVCMVNSTAVGILAGITANITIQNSTQESCPVTSQIRDDYEGEFIWTTYQQGMLFAAIYWGSLISFPAGYLSDRYSPKHVLSLAIVVNAIGSALIPVSAEYGGYAGLFVVRFVMGAGQGLTVPAVSAFISRWIPPNERSTVISLYTAGNQLASIAGMPLCAWLCQLKTIHGGWPLIFFSASTLGLACSFVWSLCVTNGPEKNSRLAPSEKAFILESTQAQNVHKNRKEFKNIPWKAMATSLPVWACVVCNFADGVLTGTLSSYLPTYFMEVLHLGLNINGVYSAAPSLVQALSKFGMAALSDELKASRRISATKNCKIFNTVGFIGPAIFLGACSSLTCTQGLLAVTFLCLSLGLFAGATPGFMTSQIALAPAYAGTVSAISTAAFQIGSILAPYLVGAITTHGTRQEWQIVFASIAAVLLFAGVFFLWFGSADIQEWATFSTPKQTVNNSVPDVAAINVPSTHSVSLRRSFQPSTIRDLDILPSANPVQCSGPA